MEASQSERPHSVAAFETLSIICLVLELTFVSGFSWDDLVWVPLMLWVVLSITRRKSSVARWIFTAICGLGFAIIAYVLAAGLAELSDIEWTGWVLSVTAIAQLALLWSRGTSQWVSSKRFDAMRTEAAA